MNFDIKEISTATMVLFAIIDIIGLLPVIITMRKRVDNIEPLKVTLVSISLMLVFLFLGEEILSLIGISVSSFAVAGAIVVFIIALEMILGVQIHRYEHQNSKQSVLVPLAFPIVIGPGTLTSLLSLRAEFQTENIIVAIVINTFLVYLVLRFSGVVDRHLSPAATQVIQRVFGVVLMAIAVKLFASNIKHLF